MFQIGSFQVDGQVILAPMAGISDSPFRAICESMGAAYSVSEMITAQTRLWGSAKSQNRLQSGNTKLNVVQIAGSEAHQLADAARQCEGLGAQVVDINMGCPAKKVCNRAAGSALLKDEKLVGQILEATVSSVSIPVTLKIRTGWDKDNRNAVKIAKMAENLGIKALTVHGRTRSCRFHGQAEYDTIAAVVDAVDIPVIANGDIDSPEKAINVLAHTSAKAVMIGRAARGNPWLIRLTDQALRGCTNANGPSREALAETMLKHLDALHRFYGENMGVKIARKHIGWYLQAHASLLKPADTERFRKSFNSLTLPLEQINTVRVFFDRLYQLEDQVA